MSILTSWPPTATSKSRTTSRSGGHHLHGVFHSTTFLMPENIGKLDRQAGREKLMLVDDRGA